jgi:hypothetical protein
MTVLRRDRHDIRHINNPTEKVKQIS